MKRVSEHQALHFLRHLIALDAQCRQLLRQARQHDAGGLGDQDNDSLLRECLENLCGPGPHARSQFEETVPNCF